MCGPPLFQIYMFFAETNAVVIFLDGSAFAVDFAILRSDFGTARRSQKGTVKMLSFFFY